MSGSLVSSTRLLAALALASVITSGCSERSFHFSYNHHGEDWLDGECASRDRQSPIDFGAKAPWTCNPPVLPFLRQYLGPVYFRTLGFAKLAGDAPLPPMPPAAALGAASMLQTKQNASWPAAAVPLTPPAPPPMMVPGCGVLDAFYFLYDKAEKPLTIQNNGHTISTDLKGHGLGSINWEGMVFDVLNVNFHVNSEHTFNGKKMPLELHIVHREPETEHILVIAVPFKEVAGASLLQAKRRGLRRKPLAIDADDVSDAADLSSAEEESITPKAVVGPKEPKITDPGFSAALANLLSYPLPADGKTSTVPLRAGPVDLISPLIGGASLIPSAFFQYRGSLTAPPCSEQVTWLVRKEPLIASHSQIELLRVAIMQANSNFANARSVMPLMDRHILYRLAINGEPPPPPSVPFDASKGPPPVRHVDFRGVAAAKEAVFKALEASQAKDMLTSAVAAAQQVRSAAAAGVDASVAAASQAVAASGDVIITTPLPTPNPEIVLSRMVDAVAEQMDGAEKAGAMAAAGVVAAPR